MSDPAPEQGGDVKQGSDVKLSTRGGKATPSSTSAQTKRNQPPKTIAARSESWNSFTRLILGGLILLTLCATLIIAVMYESTHVKDLLLVIGTLGASYVAGRGDSGRKEERT